MPYFEIEGDTDYKEVKLNGRYNLKVGRVNSSADGNTSVIGLEVYDGPNEGEEVVAFLPMKFKPGADPRWIKRGTAFRNKFFSILDIDLSGGGFDSNEVTGKLIAGMVNSKPDQNGVARNQVQDWLPAEV